MTSNFRGRHVCPASGSWPVLFPFARLAFGGVTSVARGSPAADRSRGLDQQFFRLVGHKRACQYVPPTRGPVGRRDVRPPRLLRYRRLLGALIGDSWFTSLLDQLRCLFRFLLAVHTAISPFISRGSSRSRAALSFWF